MTARPAKNTIASLHQRLLNAANQSGRAFNDLVMYYAIERFLYRLSISPSADRIVLKGGLLIHVWNAAATRVTRDIDLLATLGNSLENMRQVVQVVCSTRVADDGLIFDEASVVTEPIATDADYQGVRATFAGRFGKMRLPMQIDFGFSDVITPAPAPITYPSLLHHPPARLLAYNRETVVAEKFQAMIKLGELNSRMKDFFDVWLLAKDSAFEQRALAAAIAATFARRGTDVDDTPVCFTQRFASSPSKQTQWRAFTRTSRVTGAPADFAEVITRIREFLQPVVEALTQRQPSDMAWVPGGGWQR